MEELPLPSDPVGSPESMGSRIFDFLESAWFTVPVGIVGGIVGIFFYAPVLFACGASILLGFHKKRVVGGRSIWKVQVPSYLALCLLTMAGLYWVHRSVQIALKNANISLTSGIVSGVTDSLFRSSSSSPNIPTQKTLQSPTPISRKLPTIQISASLKELPLVANPKSKMRAILISEIFGVNLREFSNDTSHDIYFPRSSAIEPPEIVHKIDFSNHSTTDVFDVVAKFNLTLLPGNQKFAVEGVVADSLLADTDVSIYIINESSCLLFVSLPRSATLKVGDSYRDVTVPLVPFGEWEGKIPDQKTLEVSIFRIYPSTHKWAGDEMLDTFNPPPPDTDNSRQQPPLPSGPCIRGFGKQ